MVDNRAAGFCRKHSANTVEIPALPEKEKWLSVPEIADILGISRPTAYDLIAAQVPHVRAGRGGRGWRVAETDFQNWVNKQRRENLVGTR